MRREPVRVLAFLTLVAVLAIGCGGDQATPPATDADTVGLPQEERNYVACLRKAGIKVRVPSSVRKPATEGEYQKRTPHGVEGRFNLFFYMFDKRQRLTNQQKVAAEQCDKNRPTTTQQTGATDRRLSAKKLPPKVERVDELGKAVPEVEKGRKRTAKKLPDSVTIHTPSK